VEAGVLVFDGVEDALKVPGSELRLFGKPQSFIKRRMGVALARATTTDEARANAKKAAATVKPRPA
jgi:phosphoribosylglycinamide formyltransferase 2